MVAVADDAAAAVPVVGVPATCLNEHGLAELTDVADESPVKWHVERLCSLVRIKRDWWRVRPAVVP